MPLTVLLSGHVAGSLASDAHGHPRFEYSPEWVGTAGAYPISLSLPLVLNTPSPQQVSAVLWGLMPDNEGLLQRWGSHFHVSPRNPVALLAHVGVDCAGAIQFVAEERLERVIGGHDDSVSFLSTHDVAERLRGVRQERGMGRQVQDIGQFSLAGAQSKIALLRYDDGRWAIPAGRIPTTHILKPPGGDYEGFVENEMFCLSLARRMGLSAARAERQIFESESAICVERYDRVQIRTSWQRIHQEDFCQALGVMPHIKYQSQGGPGPADMAAVLWRHSTQPRADVDTLFKALIFNYLIGGTDAHAKNYSLLFGSGGSIRLAPLYDISSALPYPALQKRKIKMAMKIGSHYRWWDIRLEDWQSTAADMNVDPAYGLQALADMATRLPESASKLHAEFQADGIDHPLLDRLVQEITSSCARCLGKFAASV